MFKLNEVLNIIYLNLNEMNDVDTRIQNDELQPFLENKILVAIKKVSNIKMAYVNDIDDSINFYKIIILKKENKISIHCFTGRTAYKLVIDTENLSKPPEVYIDR